MPLGSKRPTAGRPTRSPDGERVLVHVRLAPETMNQIRAIRTRSGEALTHVVERLIIEGLKGACDAKDLDG